MSALDKNKLAAPRTTKVSIEELGGDVFVRSLTEGEFDRLARIEQDSEAGQKEVANSSRVLMVRFGVCDETGKNLFADEDFDLIRGIPFQVVNQLIEAVRQATGLKKGAVEDAEKN